MAVSTQHMQQIQAQAAAAPSKNWRPVYDIENSEDASISSGGGNSFNIPIDLSDYTTTLMILEATVNISAASNSTIYQYPWDRLLSSLSIVSNKRDNYVNLDGVTLQNVLRFKGVASPRIDLPSSGSNQTYKVYWPIHFGTKPFRTTADGSRIYDPYDITAGIPPQTDGQLAVSGTFGTAALMGSGITLNSGTLAVRSYGRAALPGQSSAPMPKAVPQWTTQSQNSKVASPSVGYQTTVDVPNGNFLRQILISTGISDSSGNFKYFSDNVLAALQLYDTSQSHIIFGDSDWTAMVQQGQQFEYNFRQSPLMDPDNGGTPTGNINSMRQISEPGLFWYDFAVNGADTDPQYGTDLRNVPTGRLKFKFSVNNNSDQQLWFAYVGYQVLAQGSSTATAVATSQATMASTLQQFARS